MCWTWGAWGSSWLPSPPWSSKCWKSVLWCVCMDCAAETWTHCTALARLPQLAAAPGSRLLAADRPVIARGLSSCARLPKACRPLGSHCIPAGVLQDAEFLENKRARKEGREDGAGAYVTPGRRKQNELDAALQHQLVFEVGLQHSALLARSRTCKLYSSSLMHCLHTARVPLQTAV